MDKLYDLDELVEEARLARERMAAAGPFASEVRGVRVEVDLDGAIQDVAFDPGLYRVTSDHDLCTAIVAAYRAAQDNAEAAEEDMARRLFHEMGADQLISATIPIPDEIRLISDQISRGHLTVGDPRDEGVTLTMSGDGCLVTVDISARLRRRHDRTDLADLITSTIHAAEQAVTEFREDVVARNEWATP